MGESVEKSLETYAEGMGEIKADDRLKADLIRRLSQERERMGNTGRYRGTLHRTAYWMAACAVALVIFLFGLPNLQGTEHLSETGRPFHRFVLTAYAADGSSFEIKPQVEFLLGRYSPLMSSVPGFPLKAEAEGADRIEWMASEGNFVLWNPPDYKVYNKGQSVSLRPGETLYWSPLDEGAQTAAEKSAVTVTAYADGKKVGSAQIEIASDKDYFYKGKLVTLESVLQTP
ncbi:hypothetical protein [Gorillibacterium massiliense]|uniref:hypothetical protein n=1 Tax=Gorillibacterium massiliense TaxID=1280390 RepID=UPI0004B652B6|nr:hypothetical protein [Gorillibacterium massiliense]